MDAVKFSKLNMPDAIDFATSDAAKYHAIESRVAYLKLVSKEGEKYYKKKNQWDDEINKNLIGLINAEIYSIEEHLEEEREKYKPLGFRFADETIDLELALFDSMQEQIKYLKKKINEFDLLNSDVATNEYEEIVNKLKIRLSKKERLLGVEETYEGNQNIKAEEKEETQRDKIRKFLKSNYPNFMNDPADESNLAAEFVENTYSNLTGKDKKKKINVIRVELVGMKSKRISLELSRQ